MTIDKAQGKECDIVIFSCTVQSQFGSSKPLTDRKRLNVAITRAKKQLIIIGTETFLRDIDAIGDIVSILRRKKWCLELEHFGEMMKAYLPFETPISFG